MTETILITVDKEGKAHSSSYASLELAEQAWEVARDAISSGQLIGVGQYRHEEDGQLGPERCIMISDTKMSRMFLRSTKEARKRL